MNTVEHIAEAVLQLAAQTHITPQDRAVASGMIAALCTYLATAWDMSTQQTIGQIVSQYGLLLARSEEGEQTT